eukprot:1614551-Prymnesium_polylepis.1
MRRTVCTRAAISRTSDVYTSSDSGRRRALRGKHACLPCLRRVKPVHAPRKAPYMYGCSALT